MAVLTILMTGAAHRQAVDPAPPATMTKRPCRARIRLPAEPGIGSLWVTDPGPGPVSAVPPFCATADAWRRHRRLTRSRMICARYVLLNARSCMPK